MRTEKMYCPVCGEETEQEVEERDTGVIGGFGVIVSCTCLECNTTFEEHPRAATGLKNGWV